MQLKIHIMPTVKKSPAPKKSGTGKSTILRKMAQKKTAPAKKSVPKLSDKNMLANFFVDELRDIYWAGKHLIKLLTKMDKSATATALKGAVASHRGITEGHIARLEDVFALLKQKPVAKKCEAMAGITKEGDDIMAETEKGTETRDVGLIFAAQKVEHYEIATYGSLAELARTLGLQKISEILDKTLAEEKEADEELSKLAVRSINEEASHETEKPGFFERIANMIG